MIPVQSSDQQSTFLEPERKGVLSWFLNLVCFFTFCCLFFWRVSVSFSHSVNQGWALALDISPLMQVPRALIPRCCLCSFPTTALMPSPMPLSICHTPFLVYPTVFHSQERYLSWMVQFYLFSKPSSNVTSCIKPSMPLANPFFPGKTNHSLLYLSRVLRTFW